MIIGHVVLELNFKTSTYLITSFIGHGPSYKKLKFFPLGCFVLSVFEIETEIEIEI